MTQVQADIPLMGDKRPWWMAVLPCAACLALAFLLYANAINNPFIIDDSMMVLAHPALTQPGGFWHIWTHGFWEGVAQDANLYRPVTVLSYWAHGVMTGLGPAPVRCVNIALLGLCAWAGGALLARHVSAMVAWMCVGVWLALPSNTESINHTVGRADLLALLGVLLFLLIQDGAARRGGWTALRMVGGLLAGVLAVGSKETGLLVAACALAQGWVLMGQVPEAARVGIKKEGTGRGKRFLVQSCVLVAAVAGVYLAARFAVVGTGAAYPQDTMDLTGNPLRTLAWQDRLAPGLWVVWWYFTQGLWGSSAFNHTPAALPDSRDIGALMGFVALAGLLGLTVRGVMKRAWYCVPGVLALGSVLILSNMMLVIGVFCANRLTPSVTMGVWMLLGVGLDGVFKRYLNDGRGRMILGLAGVVLIGVSGLRTVMANTDWASLTARMKADVQEQPDNPIALYNLGTSYMEAGDYADGARELEKVVNVRPGSAQARMNLAGALLLSREYPKAEAQYQAVLGMQPPAVKAFEVKAATALGVIALFDQDYAKAEKNLTLALAMAPEDTDALFNLGETLKATRRYPQAIRVYGRVLEIAPGHTRATKAREELGRYLEREKKVPEEKKAMPEAGRVPGMGAVDDQVF